MDGVPVLAGGHGHAADGEILVQLVEGGGAAATAGHGHGCANLHALVDARAVKQAVKQ